MASRAKVMCYESTSSGDAQEIVDVGDEEHLAVGGQVSRAQRQLVVPVGEAVRREDHAEAPVRRMTQAARRTATRSRR